MRYIKYFESDQTATRQAEAMKKKVGLKLVEYFDKFGIRSIYKAGGSSCVRIFDDRESEISIKKSGYIFGLSWEFNNDNNALSLAFELFYKWFEKFFVSIDEYLKFDTDSPGLSIYNKGGLLSIFRWQEWKLRSDKTDQFISELDKFINSDELDLTISAKKYNV